MTLWRGTQPLVLASKSTARISLLVAAGLSVETVAVDVDERVLEAQANLGDPRGIASLLAQAKALAGSAAAPGRLVVGADQVLALGQDILHKPVNLDEARIQLQRLSGRVHALHSAVAVAKDGQILFESVPTALLTMRALSDDAVDAYLSATGELALSSVGAYQVEGLGVHLFDAIDGDHFTILGLPLLKLLGFFRAQGLLV